MLPDNDETIVSAIDSQRRRGYSVVESMENAGLIAPDREVSDKPWEIDEFRDVPYNY